MATEPCRGRIPHPSPSPPACRPELAEQPPRIGKRGHARPLLSLDVGPLSIPLLPPLAAAPEPPVAAAAAEAAAAPAASGAAPTPEQQLAVALTQADPGLAARLAATGERVDAAFLQRWLRARGSVQAAAAAILAHAAWRQAFVGAEDSSGGVGGGPGSLGAGAASAAGGLGSLPLGRGIGEASIADELAARKVFLQGQDASGCPVVVVQAARWARCLYWEPP